MSALLAPIMMLVQTGHVMHILFGFDTGWNPQRRDDGSVPFKDIVRKHRSHMVLGVVSLFAGLLISPSLVAWMSPTIAGLVCAIPLSWASRAAFHRARAKRLRAALHAGGEPSAGDRHPRQHTYRRAGGRRARYCRRAAPAVRGSRFSAGARDVSADWEASRARRHHHGACDGRGEAS